MTEQDWQEQFDALCDRARRMEPGEAKVLTLEEAARLADTHGEGALGYEARTALIEAAIFAGMPEHALVAYAWCRGQQQRAPEHYDAEQLLWRQKWVVGVLSEFPHIDRARISAALDDLEQGCAKVGAGERAVLKLRYTTAREMGERAQAEALRTRWLATPTDHLTDCLACELNAELYQFRDEGDYARLLREAQPLLDGREKCAKVPHVTFGPLLYPLFKLGEFERARDYHLRGYALVRGDRSYVTAMGEHLEFLAVTGNARRGLMLLERHLGWTLEHTSPSNCFDFYLGALAVLERAGAEGHTRVALSLPPAFPAHAPEGRYETAALRDWFATRAEELAAKFDARNATDHFRRTLAHTRGLAAEARHVPIED